MNILDIIAAIKVIITIVIATEAEKPGWRVGIANRKVFERPESF